MPSVGKTADIRARVLLKVGSISSPGLEPPEEAVDLCVETGLTHYNGMKPRVIADESSGDGSTRRFVLATLLGAGYDPDFSQIRSVQRITDLDTDDERVDDSITHEIRINASAGHVLFISTAIGASNTMRVVYTAHHVIDESDEANTTVPDVDTDLLTCLAAMYTAYWISRKAGDLMIAEMGVTEVNLRRMREHWADRAHELGKEAGEFLTPSLVSLGSAGVAIQWPTTSGFGVGRVSHRER